MMGRDVIHNIFCIPQGTKTIAVGADGYISKVVDMYKAQGAGCFLTVETVDDETLLDNVTFIIEESDEIDETTGLMVDPVETDERNVYTTRFEDVEWNGITYRNVAVGYGGYKQFCRFKLVVESTAGGAWNLKSAVGKANAKKYPTY